MFEWWSSCRERNEHVDKSAFRYSCQAETDERLYGVFYTWELRNARIPAVLNVVKNLAICVAVMLSNFEFGGRAYRWWLALFK